MHPDEILAKYGWTTPREEYPIDHILASIDTRCIRAIDIQVDVYTGARLELYYRREFATYIYTTILPPQQICIWHNDDSREILGEAPTSHAWYPIFLTYVALCGKKRTTRLTE